MKMNGEQETQGPLSGMVIPNWKTKAFVGFLLLI